MKKFVLLFMLGGLFISAGCTPYSSSVQVKTHHQISPNTSVSFYFSDSDRRVIRDYYLNYYGFKKIPPGHYKRRGRPFHRHKPLPSNIYYRPLPRDLEYRLPPLPRDYIRVRIGDDIAIMNTRTRVIYDVMWFFD